MLGRKVILFFCFYGYFGGFFISTFSNRTSTPVTSTRPMSELNLMESETTRKGLAALTAEVASNKP